VVCSPGNVVDLIDLIRAQIDSNCPGSAAYFRVHADTNNSGPVYFGIAGNRSGVLSTTNYGYLLESNSPAVIYTSTYPGSPTPLGTLQVLSALANRLHVEVTT
jgi:hypothetical protein